MRIQRILPILVLFMLLVGAGEISGQWQVLGSRNVSNRIEKDTIYVTAARGEFRQIRMRVMWRPVRFYRMVINYSNGSRQNVILGKRVGAGKHSKTVRLNSGRFIRNVEVWYDAKSFTGGDARILLMGR